MAECERRRLRSAAARGLVQLRLPTVDMDRAAISYCRSPRHAAARRGGSTAVCA